LKYLASPQHLGHTKKKITDLLCNTICDFEVCSKYRQYLFLSNIWNAIFPDNEKKKGGWCSFQTKGFKRNYSCFL